MGSKAEALAAGPNTRFVVTTRKDPPRPFVNNPGSGRKIFLVLDNGPCHTSKDSRAILLARAGWLHVLWLAPYCPISI